MSEYKVG